MTLDKMYGACKYAMKRVEKLKSHLPNSWTVISPSWSASKRENASFKQSSSESDSLVGSEQLKDSDEDS